MGEWTQLEGVDEAAIRAHAEQQRPSSSREPVCLGCAWDRYMEQYDAMTDHREWPTTPKTCHVCGMTTEMGYSVTTARGSRSAGERA